MSTPVQPVIIVKKKGAHAGHHGGAWKVAYADFVTAMMAFFLVMWLVNQSPAVKAGVGGYFRDPIAFAEGGRGVLPGADSLEEPKPQAPVSAQDDERKRLELAVTNIKEALDAVPAFEALKGQVEFTVTPEGLRIDLIEKAESSFFDSGSATLRGESEHLLGVIAKELGVLDHEMDVEGHTDSRQYVATERYSNWELSADRANAARRVIERSGVRPGQITGVRGFADRELRVPEDPLDPRNRRVSILVKSPILKAAQAVHLVETAPPPPAGSSPATTATGSADAVAHEVEQAIPGVQRAAAPTPAQH
ncbi:MAG: flagellar motor protein MotB [Acidobacteriota bacterium]